MRRAVVALSCVLASNVLTLRDWLRQMSFTQFDNGTTAPWQDTRVQHIRALIEFELNEYFAGAVLQSFLDGYDEWTFVCRLQQLRILELPEREVMDIFKREGLMDVPGFRDFLKPMAPFVVGGNSGSMSLKRSPEN